MTEYHATDKKILKEFEFRNIKQDEAGQAAAIEQICFPPNEACSPKAMKKRIAAAPELFLVAVDKESGKIAGFLNGIATDEQRFRDAFFTDEGLHRPAGENVMLLGLDVLPEYRGRGLGRELVYQYLRREREKNRRKVILTCLEPKVKMYEKFGFADCGISDSTWGGEQWHEMSFTMHKLSVQSAGTIRQDDIEAGYRMIKEAGFDCVDFNFDEYLHCSMVRNGEVNDVFDRPVEEVWRDFEPHARAAAKYGLTFEQMHAPFPLMQEGKDAVNEKMLGITENCMDICSRMGGRYIVVHPVTLSDSHSRKEQYDYNIEMYKKLIPLAKKYGLVICLENMFVERNGHLLEGVCSDFAEAAAMTDELNELAGAELFGFCFDVGHANILGKNLYRSVTELGSRIKILHIHDNDGISDLHTMPFTFARGWNGPGTDWEGFLRGLREIGYRGPLNFETFRCMDGFPRELHPSVLRLLADMGRYFAEKV